MGESVREKIGYVAAFECEYQLASNVLHDVVPGLIRLGVITRENIMRGRVLLLLLSLYSRIYLVS